MQNARRESRSDLLLVLLDDRKNLARRAFNKDVVDLRHRWCTEHRRRLKAHGTDAARYHEHAHKHGVDNKARARPSRVRYVAVIHASGSGGQGMKLLPSGSTSSQGLAA